MRRPLVVLAQLALLSLLVPEFLYAQPTPIKLTSQPMAASVPALKYRLLPELRDQQQGNAALLYYRACSPEWQHFRHLPKFMTRLQELGQKPFKELRLADLEELASVLKSKMLQELDRGARRSYCDWELTERLREEGIGMLLPDLQGLREFSTMLSLRAYQELLENKYDQAAHTIQTGLAMARHTAEGPTLIHGLVGIAMANRMLQVVEAWIERPGAPNLYWSLTYLPHPLIDLRSGLQGERLIIDNLFPGYREMLTTTTTPQSLATLQTTFKRYMGITYQQERGPKVPLLQALQTYPVAKQFLLQKGRTAEQVEGTPVLQVIFLYEVYQCDLYYDEMLKLAGLPYYEAVPRLRAVVERVKEEPSSSLAALLLPAMEGVLGSREGLERKFAALRCIEALRLHAASHAGKLPEKLDEVTEVPVPVDPWTGKPFGYEVKDGKAILSGLPLPGGQQGQSSTLHYELTLRPGQDKKQEKPEETRPEAAEQKGEQTTSPAALIQEETFAVVRLDMTRLDVEGFIKTLTTLLPTHKDDLARYGTKARQFQAAFINAGGTELHLSFSTANIPAISLIQAPLKEGADIAGLTKLLKEIPLAGNTVEKRPGSLVVAARSELARLAKGKLASRAELEPALAAAGDSAVQVLLLPSDDQRRVIDEVLTLPIPGVSARTLTQGARWAALGLNLGPKPTFKLTLQAANEVAAKKMADLINVGFTLLGKIRFPGEEKSLRELFPKDFASAIEALKPMVTEDRLTIRVGEEAKLAAIAALVMDFEKGSNGGFISVADQNMKQILLAMHNFCGGTGAFPAHAIYSKDGKPLLSWRVALLPYIEQGQLYNEFHLNEPWDSDHNKKLIARMPKLYRSPKIKDGRVGLTTYLVPINKDFVFTGTNKGATFNDILDGTSNTGILLDVADETGVIWTKPDDLVVDQKDPWKGLLGHYPSHILAGMADGSVQRINKKAAAANLWALFTRAGGEVIPDLSK